MCSLVKESFCGEAKRRSLQLGYEANLYRINER